MKDSFWNDFFAVIGIKRRVEAIYEEPVKTLSGKFGHIDVFWESKPLAVYKSARSELMKKRGGKLSLPAAFAMTPRRFDEVDATISPDQTLRLSDNSGAAESGAVASNSSNSTLLAAPVGLLTEEQKAALLLLLATADREHSLVEKVTTTTIGEEAADSPPTDNRRLS